MSEAACFRCDWIGRTRATRCPRCGTPLYRETVPAAPRPAPHPGAHATTSEPRRAEPQDPVGRGASSWWSRPAVSLVAVAALALFVSLVWSRIPSNSGARAAADPSTGPEPAPLLAGDGFLLYAADRHGADGQILWSLDASLRIALPGPEIPGVTSLVDASLAGRGWVGLVTSTSAGQAAWVLSGTAPDDEPRRVAAGDLVAWGPRGQIVAAASEVSTADRCPRIRLDVVEVADRARERVLDVRSCEPLRSIGRDGQATYLGMGSDDRARIELNGMFGVLHPVLRGFDMISVSPASDFLLSRPRRPAGAVLYWRGVGGPVPIRDANGRLSVRSVLAWSSDASQALVDGSAAGRRGVFLVDAGAGPTTRRAVRIAPSGVDLGGTFAPDGTVYLAIGGRLFAYADDRLVHVPLPSGAAPPAGPVLWVP